MGAGNPNNSTRARVEASRNAYRFGAVVLYSFTTIAPYSNTSASLPAPRRRPNASLLMVFTQRLTYDVCVIAHSASRDHNGQSPKSSHKSRCPQGNPYWITGNPVSHKSLDRFETRGIVAL